jgi:hypothetical protein
MAKDGKHVIHAGGVFYNPLLNREGMAASGVVPGTIGTFLDGIFNPLTAMSEAAITYVANYDYLRCKTVDDAYTAGELAVAIQPMQGMFLNVRAVAGTYNKGEPLTVANGQVKAATISGETPDTVFAYCEEDQATTVVAGDLLRVVFK